MNNTDLLSFFVEKSYSLETITLTLLSACIFGTIIALIYKYTHNGISYSQSFVITLLMLTVITSLAMTVIGGNVVTAFALLGTFTIIRFRTAVKDSRDTAFVFFALVIGLAVGTQQFMISLIGTLVITILAFLLYKFQFGSVKLFDYILTIQMNGYTAEKAAKINSVSKEYAKHLKVIRVHTFTDGQTELVYSLSLRNASALPTFVDTLKNTSDVTNVELLSQQQSVEY